jgi:hypothetical protein
MDQLEDNLRAANVSLTDEEQAAIAEVSKIPAEYPAWMIEPWCHFRRTQLANSRRRLSIPFVRSRHGLRWGGELDGVL